MNELLAYVTQRYPGGVVAASYDGEREIHPFGTVLTTEGRRPAETGDRFLLTSITKFLTATQLHLLALDGRLGLRDRVADHVPAFAANAKSQISVAQLLTHTAGIDPSANTAEHPDAANVAGPHLAAAMGAGLVSAPGERFAYSSPGFWALAELISARARQPYDAHLRDHVCAPLGMTATGYEIGTEMPQRYALRDAPGPQHQHEAARMAGYPSGGVVASAEDMLTFGEAFATTLAPVAAAVRDGHVEGIWQDVPVRWGIGAELGGPSPRWPRESLFASGASGTALWIDPESSRVAVLLTASWEADRASLAEVGDLVVGH